MILISDRDFDVMARAVEMIRYESGENRRSYNVKRMAKLAVGRIKARREKETER